MLRNSNLNLRPPKMKTKFGQNSFAYRGAKIWNSLPNDCRKANTFPAVKEKLKVMIAQHHIFFSLSFVLLSFSLFIIGLYFTLYMYFFLFKGGPLKTSFAEG